MPSTPFLLLLGLGLTVAACESSSRAAGPPMPDGETVYMRSCAACHQADGRGMVGKFPSLIAPKQPDLQLQISIVLNGVRTMPAHRDLSNTDLAAVLTYIRTSWGNQLGAVRPEDVARSRF